MSCCGLEFQFLCVLTHSRLHCLSTRSTFYVPNPPSPLGYNRYFLILPKSHRPNCTKISKLSGIPALSILQFLRPWYLPSICLIIFYFFNRSGGVTTLRAARFDVKTSYIMPNFFLSVGAIDRRVNTLKTESGQFTARYETNILYEQITAVFILTVLITLPIALGYIASKVRATVYTLVGNGAQENVRWNNWEGLECCGRDSNPVLPE